MAREKGMEMEKLDDPTVLGHWITTFSISIFFSLTKSLIQTQPKAKEAEFLVRFNYLPVFCFIIIHMEFNPRQKFPQKRLHLLWKISTPHFNITQLGRRIIIPKISIKINKSKTTCIMTSIHNQTQH